MTQRLPTQGESPWGTVLNGFLLVGLGTDGQLKAIQAVNVKDPEYGAVGDGTTNDTAAILEAVATGAPLIFVPPGTYRMTSGITLTTAQTIVGAGFPGSADNDIASVLMHDFSGDFITLTGTNGTNDLGTGGGLANLQLLQANGNGSGASGTAIKFIAGSSTFFPARTRIDSVQIETGNGVNSWTYCLRADGTLDTTHGITDLYVSRSRFVGDTNATAAILLENGRNIHIFECQLTGVNAHLNVTGGPAANQFSSSVNITGVSGANLVVAKATNVIVSAGSFVNLSMTSDTSYSSFFPGILDNLPTMTGTNNVMGSLIRSSGNYELKTSTGVVKINGVTQ